MNTQVNLVESSDPTPTILANGELEAAIRDALEADLVDELRELLADQYAIDIAEVIERLDDETVQYRVFELLPPDLAAEVLDEAGAHTTRALLRQMPSDRLAGYLNRMPMDDVVELLADDIPERQDEILSHLHSDMAKELRELLEYPPQSAGRLMTRKYVRIKADMTANEALNHLRRVDSRVETVNDLYVLDLANRLIGVVSLREVINMPSGKQIKDVMTTDVVTVRPDEDQERAARTLARYDILSLPVTTPDNKMLGIITADDVFDVLTQENTEDVLRFGGVEGGMLDQPYFTVPIRTVIRTRIGWLLLLFLAQTLTGSVMQAFQSELEAVVALAFFIPLLIGTGGNAGAQTVSTIIRGVAVKEIRTSDLLRVLRRELGSGLLLGILLGIVAFVRTLLWGDHSPEFALVIALAILAICTWANVIGAAIPLIAHRLRIDPALVSAPLITTLVDATGLLIYFLIAKALLDL